MSLRTRAAAAAEQAPAVRWQVLRRGLREAGAGARAGALIGLIVAGLMLLIGLGRAALFVLGGGGLRGLSGGDLRQLGAYVGAFVVGGALVGAVQAVWANRIATTLAIMAAGVGVMNAIALSDALNHYDRSTAIWMTGLGAFFGLAFDYGMHRRG